MRRGTLAYAPRDAILRRTMSTLSTNITAAACIYGLIHHTGESRVFGSLTRENVEQFSLASML